MIRHTHHPEATEPGKIQIVIPEVDNAISIGSLMLEGNLQLNVIDPLGTEWDPHASLERLAQLFHDFLGGREEFLELESPIDGQPYLLTRRAVERVLVIQGARAQIANPRARSDFFDVTRGGPLPPPPNRHRR